MGPGEISGLGKVGPFPELVPQSIGKSQSRNGRKDTRGERKTAKEQWEMGQEQLLGICWYTENLGSPLEEPGQ